MLVLGDVSYSNIIFRYMNIIMCSEYNIRAGCIKDYWWWEPWNVNLGTNSAVASLYLHSFESESIFSFSAKASILKCNPSVNET